MGSQRRELLVYSKEEGGGSAQPCAKYFGPQPHQWGESQGSPLFPHFCPAVNKCLLHTVEQTEGTKPVPGMEVCRDLPPPTAVAPRRPSQLCWQASSPWCFIHPATPSPGLPPSSSRWIFLPPAPLRCIPPSSHLVKLTDTHRGLATLCPAATSGPFPHLILFRHAGCL